MLDDKELLYSIAILYYKESLTQQKISEKMGISRPMVSRALEKALKMGIVQVDIIPPAGVSEKEQRLAKLLGINEVIISPKTDSRSSDRNNRIQDIAVCAGNLLLDLIQGKKNVGIGWGKTVYQTVLSSCGSKERSNVRFVPLVGSLGRTEPYFQVNVILDRITEKMKGEGMFYNFPAFVKAPQIANYFMKDEQLLSIKQVWNNLDLAIFGLGGFGGEPSFPIEEYSDNVLQKLHENEIVGDILGRFFNAKGFITCGSGPNSYIPANSGNEEESKYFGISIEAFMKAKDKVCLCGGEAKVDGIISACKLKYMTKLITDVYTAKELLGELEK
ncbi:MAG: sugar-binding domain-containing protein [Sphaerochaetaceae bacterium]